MWILATFIIQKFVWGWEQWERVAGRHILPASSSQRECSEAQSSIWSFGRQSHQAEISSSGWLSNTRSYQLPHPPCLPHSASLGLNSSYKRVAYKLLSLSPAFWGTQDKTLITIKEGHILLHKLIKKAEKWVVISTYNFFLKLVQLNMHTLN